MSDLSTSWLGVGSSSSPSESLSSFSLNCNDITWETLFTKAASLPAILENGRKVFGPPVEYVGERPSYICELYVSNLPKSLDEVRFLAWLHRCGVVYEMRVMMQSFSTTRGYAFVRYMQEYEALVAYELLKCLFLCGERVCVYRSQGKNRLFVSNIPKQLPMSSLEEGFKKTFRDIERCIAFPATETCSLRGDLNRGFAFIEFYDHESAMEAKKKTTPGHMRMWGNDLKVQWAKPKLLQIHFKSNNEQQEIRSITAASSKPQDYCAKLRLLCLANNWCIPVVIYGNCFYQNGFQYGGILLKDPTSGQLSGILMEVAVGRDMQDVHVAMCEVAAQIIDRSNGFPRYHYMVRVLNGFRAELLFVCENCSDITSLVGHCDRNVFNFKSMVELAVALEVLAQYSTEFILNTYRRSFLVLRNCFSLKRQSHIVQFYSIFPKFRNNPPLNLAFNDTEITLFVPEVTMERNIYEYLAVGEQKSNRPYMILNSQRVRNADGYTLRYISLEKLESREFYHPEQRINVSPIWITGHSYQKSIFK
ncbi:dead end protein homolog 1 isoform X1 [Bactrocera oleae]|uniref:dead end protein homolog 1 isoform X1 n=1 Tax=Bactrocera oleae TaxID=104688 RepID=UPI0006B78A72|nr:dead end protein homolog 1-like isoform X1 [Bactrocera oleae]